MQARFEQLRADVRHALSLKRDGLWSEDQIFNRIVEEVGELARCRRTPELERNSNAGRLDEEGEVLDLIYAVICYAEAKGFPLEYRWEQDTYGRIRHASKL